MEDKDATVHRTAPQHRIIQPQIQKVYPLLSSAEVKNAAMDTREEKKKRKNSYSCFNPDAAMAVVVLCPK